MQRISQNASGVAIKIREVENLRDRCGVCSAKPGLDLTVMFNIAY